MVSLYKNDKTSPYKIVNLNIPGRQGQGFTVDAWHADEGYTVLDLDVEDLFEFAPGATNAEHPIKRGAILLSIAAIEGRCVFHDSTHPLARACSQAAITLADAGLLADPDEVEVQDMLAELSDMRELGLLAGRDDPALGQRSVLAAAELAEKAYGSGRPIDWLGLERICAQEVSQIRSAHAQALHDNPGVIRVPDAGRPSRFEPIPGHYEIVFHAPGQGSRMCTSILAKKKDLLRADGNPRALFPGDDPRFIVVEYPHPFGSTKGGDDARLAAIADAIVDKKTGELMVQVDRNAPGGLYLARAVRKAQGKGDGPSDGTPARDLPSNDVRDDEALADERALA